MIGRYINEIEVNVTIKFIAGNSILFYLKSFLCIMDSHKQNTQIMG